MRLYKINSDNYLVEHVFAPHFETEAALPGQALQTIGGGRQRALCKRPAFGAGAAVVPGDKARQPAFGLR